ncbi:MAG: hypothetical protein LBU77_03170 [Clostridiales bacterium]|jgi:hypothetical protein|nr:hypothetical protein [Clostridiales bacterium]
MISITEVNIISVDKNDEESWAIEGEILFESDLSTPFSATYLIDDDEFDDFEMEIDPGAHDKRRLKKMILDAAKEFDEEDY